MFTLEDDGEALKKASYAAYNEAIRAAYKALANSVDEYFTERHALHDHEILDVPQNFRPLRDYERALKIQKVTLRLALRAADVSEHQASNNTKSPVHPNGHAC